MRNAVAALVAHHILVVGALVARRGNNLHEGRLVILIGNVARVEPFGDVNGLVCGTERKAHRKAHALRGNLTLAVNILSVLGFFVGRDYVRNRLDIACNRIGFVGNLCHFGKNFAP